MSRPAVLLAVDIGNSGIKVCRFNSETNRTADRLEPAHLHELPDQTRRLSSQPTSPPSAPSILAPIQAGSDGMLPPLVGTVHRLEWDVELSHLRRKHSPADTGVRAESPPLDLHARMSRFLVDLLQECDSGAADEIRWYISSVQQRGLDTLLAILADQKDRGLMFDYKIQLLDRHQVPMVVQVQEPDRLGIDRLLAAWGGWLSRRDNLPLIVIQAGTAITVDAVSGDGEFLGGAILPGVQIALRNLASGTDKLPLVAIPSEDEEIVVPGRNTEQAILAGVLAAARGGVHHLVQLYRKQFGDRTSVIVSGGDGLFVANSIPPPVNVIDQLVLRSIGALSLSLNNRARVFSC